MNDLFIKDFNSLSIEEAIDYSTYLGFVMDAVLKTNEQSFNILAEDFWIFLKQITTNGASVNTQFFFNCCIEPYLQHGTWVWKIRRMYDIKPVLIKLILTDEIDNMSFDFSFDFYGKKYRFFDSESIQECKQLSLNNIKSNPLYENNIKKLLVKLRIEQLEKDFM